MQEFMYEALKELSKGEGLLHPIYGILRRGNRTFPAFFGLTDRYLLVVTISGKNVTGNAKFSLNQIKSLSVKQNPITREYTVSAGFHGSAPCVLTAFPKVLGIHSQKENLPQFLDCLKHHGPLHSMPRLRDQAGFKVRWQYFSLLFYALLSFIPAILIMIMSTDFAKGTFSWATLTEALAVSAVLLLPLAVLMLLNVFAFGKIVCVITDRGLYVENDFIPWENIAQIEYHPEIPSKYGELEFTHASLFLRENKGKPYRLDLLHFPAFALFLIKKRCPQIPIDSPRFEKILFSALALLPTVFAIGYALVISLH